MLPRKVNADSTIAAEDILDSTGGMCRLAKKKKTSTMVQCVIVHTELIDEKSKS